MKDPVVSDWDCLWNVTFNYFYENFGEEGLIDYFKHLANSEYYEKIVEIMKNKASVFAGQSGAGKSSLINVVTGLNLKTGQVVHKTKKGAHITTTAKLIPLKKGGFCIDTPGIKSFGLWDLKKEEVASYFSEITHFATECKYQNCMHMSEPDCAVKEAVIEGKISSLRFESYRSLIKKETEKR